MFRRQLSLLVGLILLCVVASPRFGGRAAAAFEHGSGFEATVAGWTSWYGSYRLAGIGTAWCVDHGIAAPDVDLGYEPATLTDHAPATQRAIAWAVDRAGPSASADPVAAAALMLALHGLMGAKYPHGRLDLDQLAVSELSGFGGHEAEVLARARAMKADAVAHGGLAPPLALTATAADGLLTVALHDAAGAPVSGVEVAVSGGLSGKGVTAADGTWRAPFAAVPGPNRFSVAASTPDVVLHAFAPTRAPAQRVVVPASVALTASAEQVVAQRHRLVIHKQGDDTGYLPVAGARFQVAGQTVAADQPIELEAGVYRVTEVTPPAGYAAAGPWPVDLTGGDVTLDVIDHGVRGSVSVTKTDSSTMQPVAGATLAIRFDADHDGRFDGQPDQQIATWSSTSGPKLVSGLLPGNYQVIELAPPPGYRSATGPSPFTVAPGQQAEVTLADAPRASVAFVKSPALSGAVFAVRNDAGVELGRCTSDTDGRCTVDADRIVVGRTACWSEVAAPPGYRVAPGACLTVARGVNVVPITEVPVPVAVTAVKRDAAGGRPLAGAGYDLVRRDADGRLATVASATSGPDGRLSWPDQPPGSDYCAVERRPPPGYSVGAAPTCAMAAVGRPIAFSLTDQALPAPPITSPPATSPPATVAAVVALAPAKNAPTPAGGSLPATGRPVATVLRTGLGLVVVGFGLLGLARLSRRSGRLP